MGEAGCAAAASGAAERCPQPERRCRKRAVPLCGEGCATCGSQAINRGCAPSGADPYPRLARASRGRITMGVRPYHGRRNGSTARRCDDQAKQPDPYPRYAEKGQGYGSRGYGPFPLMFQASANAPAVAQRGRRQGSEKGIREPDNTCPADPRFARPLRLRSEDVLVGMADGFHRSLRSPVRRSLALPPAMPSAALERGSPTTAAVVRR